MLKRHNGTDIVNLNTYMRKTINNVISCTKGMRWDGSKLVDLFPKIEPSAKTYSLVKSQIYWNNGGKDNQSTLFQGTWDGTSGHIRRSLLWFDEQLVKDLQGANIGKIELYLHRESTGGNSGGANVRIKTHNCSSVPSSWTGSDTGHADSGTPTLRRNAGAWFTLLDSVAQGFRDGTVKGIALDADSSTSMSDYVRYNRTGTYAPKIRVTYL